MFKKSILQPYRILGSSFYWLWFGQLINVLGNGMHEVAIVYLAKEVTEQPLSVGIVLAASSIVLVIFAPLGGVVADRYDKWHIIFLSNFVATAIVTLLIVVMLTADHFSVIWVYAVTLLLTIYQTFFAPTLSSLISLVVKPSNQRYAQAMTRPSIEMVRAFGAILGGILVTLLNMAFVFFCNACSFLFSNVMVHFARKSLPASLDFTHQKTNNSSVKIGQSFWQGLQHIGQVSGAKPIFFMAAVINLISAPISVLLPFHCQQAFGGGAQLYGFLMAMLTTGSLFGYLIPGLLPRHFTSSKIALLGAMTMCVGFVPFVLASVYSLACIAYFCIGLGHGAWSVVCATALQTSIGQDFRGRALSIFTMLTRGLLPVGFIIGGWLGDYLLNERSYVPILLTLALLLAIIPVVVFLCFPSVKKFFDLEKNNIALDQKQFT